MWGEAAPSGVPSVWLQLRGCWAHHPSPVLGQHGPPAPAGWDKAPPARVSREVANLEQEGNHLSLFLAATLVSGPTLQRDGENVKKFSTTISFPPPPPIIFLSGRKRPQILKRDNSPRLYSLWENMIRRSLGANLKSDLSPKATSAYSHCPFAAKRAQETSGWQHTGLFVDMSRAGPQPGSLQGRSCPRQVISCRTMHTTLECLRYVLWCVLARKQ